MSDLKLPGEEGEKKATSFNRFAVWIIVGAIGLYMVVTGIVSLVSGGAQ
jgi:hypothetical protein